jgi:hypothetical protein
MSKKDTKREMLSSLSRTTTKPHQAHPTAIPLRFVAAGVMVARFPLPSKPCLRKCNAPLKSALATKRQQILAGKQPAFLLLEIDRRLTTKENIGES